MSISCNEQVQPSPSLCGRRLSYPSEIDEQLVEWVRKEQSNGMILLPDMLRREALKLIQPYCFEFKASTGWLDKFLTRHKLTLHPPNKASNSNGFAKCTASPTDSTKMPEEGEHLLPKLLPVSEIDNQQHNDDDEDDDDEEDNENASNKKECSALQLPVNPERLKAFNMFVRLFIDENLDRLVPISKQPKEKISAIIMSCQRQFPEFTDRARKRIRTYLKSCRRSTRLREPSSKPSMSHIPSTQLTEVNNILAQACQNETHEVAKRQRLESGESVAAAFHTTSAEHHSSKVTDLQKAALSNSRAQKDLPVYSSFLTSKTKGPVLKLTNSEVVSVRNLIDGYRQSASYLHRSADELERLLKQCEAYTDAKPEETAQAEAKSDSISCTHKVDTNSVEVKDEEKSIETSKSNGNVVSSASATPGLEVKVETSSAPIHDFYQQTLSMEVDLEQRNEEESSQQVPPGLLHLRNNEPSEAISEHARNIVSSDPLSVDHLHSPLLHVRTQRSPSKLSPSVSQYQNQNIHHHKQILIPQSHSHSAQHNVHQSQQLGTLPSPQPHSSHSPQQTLVSLSHSPHASSFQNTIHAQKMYSTIRQVGTQQIRHLHQQSRQQHLHPTSYHQVGGHQVGARHQTIFNFDTTQQMMEPRQKHVHHQRLSPMPYHSVLSPVGSPHLQELSRQSHLLERQPQLPEANRQLHLQDVNRQPHLQDILRQPHLQDLSRQPRVQDVSLQSHLQDISRQSHVQDMNRQTHSDYTHSMVYDGHSSH